MTARAPLVLICAALLVSGCDRVAQVGAMLGFKSPEKAAPAAIPVAVDPNAARERTEPVRWDEGFGAFWYKDAPLNAARMWRFDAGIQGFSGGGAELVGAPLQGLQVVNRLPDAQLRSPTGLAIDGARFTLVLVRLTRLADAAPWDGSLYWMTPQHPEQDAFHTKPFLGQAPAVNETVILAYDMANPLKGGDDWTKSLIDQIRIDTDDGAGSRFRLREIAIVENPAPDVLKAPPRAAPATPAAKAAPAVSPAKAAGLR
jgi:hypothetical protein